MSKDIRSIKLVPPDLPVTDEYITSRYHRCRFCHGSGGIFGTGKRNQRTLVTCPMCGGSGYMKAEIIIRWAPEPDESAEPSEVTN